MRGKRGESLVVVLLGKGANNIHWGRKDFPGGPGLRENYTD